MRLKEAIDRAKEVNRVVRHRTSQAEYYRENREVILKRRKEVPGMGNNPSPFIVREVPWNPYEYCGRMIVRDGHLVIFIDGTGRFEVPVPEVQYVLMGLGPAGKMSLSETGKGIWIQIQGSEYVTPAERVRKVISSEHRKAAVFECRGGKFV